MSECEHLLKMHEHLRKVHIRRHKSNSGCNQLGNRFDLRKYIRWLDNNMHTPNAQGNPHANMPHTEIHADYLQAMYMWCSMNVQL